MSDTPSTPPPSQEVAIAATPDNGSNDSGSGFPDPNPQEAMFFFNMIKNMNNIPDIDWNGVAADSGFKNAAVAKIKQKLGLDARTNTTVVKPKAPPKTPTKTPAKSRKRKAKGDDTEETVKAIEAVDGGDGDANEAVLPPTPPKTPKRRKVSAKAAKVKAEIEADVTDANKSEDKTDTKSEDKTEDKTEVTEHSTAKVEPAEANVKKGRKPLPRGRVQQQTPSESGGEEEQAQREAMTDVLPSIKVNTGADMEGTV